MRSEERSQIADYVRSALPARLAQAVVGAEIIEGRLTIGVTSAAWASRLRYFNDTLRKRVSAAAGREVSRVRIKVVPWS